MAKKSKGKPKKKDREAASLLADFADQFNKGKTVDPKEFAMKASSLEIAIEVSSLCRTFALLATCLRKKK